MSDVAEFSKRGMKEVAKEAEVKANTAKPISFLSFLVVLRTNRYKNLKYS